MVLVLRNTGPPEPLTATSVILSLKVISLNGPFPRTADRKKNTAQSYSSTTHAVVSFLDKCLPLL